MGIVEDIVGIVVSCILGLAAIVAVSGVLIYGVTYLFLIPGYLGFGHYDHTGKVSSVSTVCEFLMPCFMSVEFYGGRGDMVLPDDRIGVVQPDLDCHWISNGMHLQDVTCKNMTG